MSGYWLPVLLSTTTPAAAGCEDNPNAICEWAQSTFDSEIIANLLGTVIPDLLRVVAVFAIAWVVNRLVRRLIGRLVQNMLEDQDAGPLRSIRRVGPLADTGPFNPQRQAMRTQTVGAVLRSVSSIVVWTVAVLVAAGSLDSIQLNLGPLIASAGIVGVALGFGAQSLVKDFLTGTFMLMEDQYGIGDIVDLGPATGVVEKISLRKTQIRDLEGTVWHIPNGEITRVGNLSQLWSRSLLDLGVAYDTDLRTAMEVIERVATELSRDPDWSSRILEPPEVWGVEAWAESSITIRLVVKTQAAEQWNVNRQLLLRLKEAFDAEGIEIPFPQRGLWFRSSDGAPTEADASSREGRDVSVRAPAGPAGAEDDADSEQQG